MKSTKKLLLTWPNLFRAEILVGISHAECPQQVVRHVLSSTVDGIQAPVVDF